MGENTLTAREQKGEKMDDYTRTHLDKWLIKQFEDENQRYRIRLRILESIQDNPKLINKGWLNLVDSLECWNI
jgi:hypothetical protein